MTRGLPLLGVLVLAASCGKSPTQPSAAPVVLALAPGNYTLKIEPGAPPGGFNVCGGISVNGGSFVNAYASFSVQVTEANAVWTIRPVAAIDHGLVVTLRVTGAMFEGSASGGATDGPFTVMFGSTSAMSAAAMLSGTAVSANTLSGFTTGPVNFAHADGAGGCVSYQWWLQPR